ncbi:MAG: DDE-type integrase/transposase/recombinase [Actinobacteria bacterium]|nr:DDE-type integrase/transposase/recombinase [Actinomycetota bacterium]MCA1699517.1 DDE-type integrase/transposase/recombinase [Actinomycetota bacterium]
MDRAQQIGLFRWRIVGEAMDVSLSARERGRLVRALADREHLDPDGRWVRVSRNTLDRWIRAYRQGGFDALVPTPRRGRNRTPERLLELAVALRREQPARTAAQIHRIISEAEGSTPSARTIQRHLVAAGLPWKGSEVSRALGRFEAEFRNALWTGDALHGPLIDGRRTFLFCFVDDHSRLLVGYRWAAREDVLNASRALRAGIAARGVPKAVYVDNGSPFVSGQLLRACAVLGIRLIHSRPGRPEGRGKIERAFRTVRQQLLVEIEDRPPATLEELNQIFQAWVEQVYHRRVHSETGQTPLERFLAQGPPAVPAERSLREAFRWSERRTVSMTGTVGMQGNTYEVDPGLAGRRVDLVFDPLELTEVEVRLDGRHAGLAVPLKIKRHVHPRAQPTPEEPVEPTGIDYLGLICQRRAQELQRRIDYRHLPGPPAGDAGHDHENKEHTG